MLKPSLKNSSNSSSSKFESDYKLLDKRLSLFCKRIGSFVLYLRSLGELDLLTINSLFLLILAA